MRIVRIAAPLAALALLAACASSAAPFFAAARTPEQARAEALRAEGAWTPQQAEVAIGIRLFFDPRLSRDGKTSCGTCHIHSFGFAQPSAVSTGVSGRTGTRNAPTVLGAKAVKSLFWDGRAHSLEEQALGPIQNPVEMDMTLPEIEQKLQGVAMYERLFKQAYGGPVSRDKIAKALAGFERALAFTPSTYEKWAAGDGELSPAAQRGLEVFTRKGRCTNCHFGPDLSDRGFHNTGWGLDQPNPDLGRYVVTHNAAERGAFRTPPLRNAALTAPYFHDGRAKTLEEVVDFYDRGGLDNDNLDPMLQPLELSAAEKRDLVAFLKTLDAGHNLKEIAAEAVEKRELKLP